VKKGFKGEINTEKEDPLQAINKEMRDREFCG